MPEHFRYGFAAFDDDLSQGRARLMARLTAMRSKAVMVNAGDARVL
jgi:hypothetical protein